MRKCENCNYFYREKEAGYSECFNKTVAVMPEEEHELIVLNKKECTYFEKLEEF